MNKNRKLSRKTYGPRQTQLSPNVNGGKAKYAHTPNKRPVGIAERDLFGQFMNRPE